MNNMKSLEHIQHYLIDMDGTIYLSETLFPGAREFIEELRRQKKTFLFLTNNSSANARQYQEKLGHFGIDAKLSEIFTSGAATTLYLQQAGGGKRVYLLGTPALEEEFQAAGFCLTDDQPDYVVLGFDKTLTYQKLETACNLIRGGTKYIATHPDLVCPTRTGSIPDCGAMIALIEKATERLPKIIGKPHLEMVSAALRKLGAKQNNTAMIGDRLYTDIQMGLTAGIFTILVLSGETKPEDIHNSPIQPDRIFPSVNEIFHELQLMAMTIPS